MPLLGIGDCAGNVQGVKRLLIAVVAAAALVVAGCSSEPEQAAPPSKPAPGSQTQLNEEQIAQLRALIAASQGMTWFSEIAQKGKCGEFSDTYAACEAKAWQQMNGYITAEQDLYKSFAESMAPGPCLDSLKIQIEDLVMYGDAMTKIHEAAQKMDAKAMNEVAAALKDPRATEFASACGVAAPSAEPSEG